MNYAQRLTKATELKKRAEIGQVAVEKVDSSVFACFLMPQQGGYGWMGVVEFHEKTTDWSGHLGCFDLHVFHDGEFNTEERTTVLHFCDAAQVVAAGVTVLELQVQHSTGDLKESDREKLKGYAERLLKLAGYP